MCVEDRDGLSVEPDGLDDVALRQPDGGQVADRHRDRSVRPDRSEDGERGLCALDGGIEIAQQPRHEPERLLAPAANDGVSGLVPYLEELRPAVEQLAEFALIALDLHGHAD